MAIRLSAIVFHLSPRCPVPLFVSNGSTASISLHNRVSCLSVQDITFLFKDNNSHKHSHNLHESAHQAFGGKSEGMLASWHKQKAFKYINSLQYQRIFLNKCQCIFYCRILNKYSTITYNFACFPLVGALLALCSEGTNRRLNLNEEIREIQWLISLKYTQSVLEGLINTIAILNLALPFENSKKKHTSSHNVKSACLASRNSEDAGIFA